MNDTAANNHNCAGDRNWLITFPDDYGRFTFDYGRNLVHFYWRFASDTSAAFAFTISIRIFDFDIDMRYALMISLPSISYSFTFIAIAIQLLPLAMQPARAMY